MFPIGIYKYATIPQKSFKNRLDACATMLLHLSRILGTTLLAISAISAHQNGSLARLGSAEPEGFTVPKTFGESAESTRTIHPSSKDCNWILPHFGCLPLFNQDIFVSSMLQQHNQYRARHGSPPLIWSESLALLALQNAETNLARNTFLETPDNEYGECMASQEGSNNPLWLAWIWYNETRRYSYRDAQFTEDTGHFAQM